MNMTVGDAIRSGRAVLLGNRACPKCQYTAQVVILRSQVEIGATVNCPRCKEPFKVTVRGTLCRMVHGAILNMDSLKTVFTPTPQTSILFS